MILTDMHSHSSFSCDSKCPIEELINSAIDKKINYLGISEHVNYDCLYNNLDIIKFNPETYFPTAFKLKEKYKDIINILVGIECGYYDNIQVNKRYFNLIEQYSPDFVTNSIHMIGKFDYYNSKYGTKNVVYKKYLNLIYKSINCDYYFDIVAHIGYVLRYAPYEDKQMKYKDFKEPFDKILKAIISKDKILEVNSSCNLDFTSFLPTLDVFEEYYKLGGRKISYGSDTHTSIRLLDKRENIVKILQNIGFDHFTIPINRKHIEIEF